MSDPASVTTTAVAGDGARLCAEAIGDRGDPAILLISGATAPMDWWDDELCRRLADRGRLVVRYDHRDTGRSSNWPRGEPGYTGADLVTDAVAVLDALGIARAHVAGISMGGGIAQMLALEHRDRVASLTLMATSPIDPAIEGLPGATPELRARWADEPPDPDWDDREAVIAHILESERTYAGPGMFDEARLRAIAARVVGRTTDVAASLTNHVAVSDAGERLDLRLGRLEGLPTLVLHGTADPLFPPAHGRALADAIPGARLVLLEDVGHQVPPPPTWDLVVDALVDPTRAR